MKGRAIILGEVAGGPAAALQVDGRLEDLVFDGPDGNGQPVVGALCIAKVTRKLPGKGGAFVDLGAGEGFLRDARNVAAGDTLMVQVLNLPEPGKAPTVTERILYKGPRLILTPGRSGINVSRQVKDADIAGALRATIEDGIAEADWAQGALPPFGIIVRSSAVGQGEAALLAELDWLAADWLNDLEVLGANPRPMGKPGHTVARRAFQEWLLPYPDAIVATREASEDLSRDDEGGPAVFWGDRRCLDLLRTEADPFAAMGILEDLEALGAIEVALAQGSMTIEPTRALVAVDVNTGADFSPAAGLKANLAAARDLPRQLRLRGLGGQVIVDFAPMPKKDRRTLEEAMKKAFRADPVETSLVGWTTLGHYELQRKRERRPLHEVL